MTELRVSPWSSLTIDPPEPPTEATNHALLVRANPLDRDEGPRMNHRERLLDIANEAIDKLCAQGMSRAQIARKSGVSEWSLYDWVRRECAPEPDNVEAVLNLLGRSLGLHIRVMRAKAKRIRVKYRSGDAIASVAQSLPEFHCKSLASATGVSLKAAKAWCLRNRKNLAEVRQEPADGHGRRIVWRWVGEQVAQPMAAE